MTLKQQRKDNIDVYEGQPRDSKGRYASWGLAGDGIDEWAETLERKLRSGISDEVLVAAKQLGAAVNRVPSLTVDEAERIRSIIESRGAEVIPTDLWLELDLRCRNASVFAKDLRNIIDKKRLSAGARRG